MDAASGLVRGTDGSVAYRYNEHIFSAEHVKTNMPALVCSFDNNGFVDGVAVQYYSNGKPYLVLNFVHGHLEGAQKAYCIKPGKDGSAVYDNNGILVKEDGWYGTLTPYISIHIHNVDAKYLIDTWLKNFMSNLTYLEVVLGF